MEKDLSLRARMVLAGVPISRVAAKTGLKYTTVNRILTGRTQITRNDESRDKIVKMAIQLCEVAESRKKFINGNT
jgi:plasmid maintenance system antidote protein VapI